MQPAHPPKHPWYARLIVCAIMLVISFIGLVFTNLSSQGGWDYWKWTVPIYALLALWLSWYLRRNKQSLSLVTIWHELLHWLALGASAFLVSRFLHLGLFSRMLAGLTVLLLIAQALFFAGIYIETSFVFIGLILALFALSVAFTVEYIYLYITIPIFILVLALFIWYFWRSHKKHSHIN